jgi:hypothetical protein
MILKPKKGFVMAQLNIEKLTPMQWDGIMRAMDAYADHFHECKIDELNKPVVNPNRFQLAYEPYWDKVKDIIDEDGWVYTKEAPYMLDAYFEHNTGKPIEFQKSSGASGDNPHWLTKGSRWRPYELSL